MLREFVSIRISPACVSRIPSFIESKSVGISRLLQWMQAHDRNRLAHESSYILGRRQQTAQRLCESVRLGQVDGSKN